MIGSFSVVDGLAAIFDDGYIVVSRRYAFDLDVTAWGWIHLVLGVAVVAVGIGLFMSKTWAGRVAIVLAVLTAIDFFFSFPTHPFWSVLVIALSVWLIWAVTLFFGQRARRLSARTKNWPSWYGRVRGRPGPTPGIRRRRRRW